MQDKFAVGLHNGLVLAVALWALILLTTQCFSAPPTVKYEKIDDYHIKVIMTKVHNKTDETVKTEKEKIYTVSQLNDVKASHVSAKQSWLDSQSASEAIVEENVEIQDEEIDTYTSILAECENLGVIEEPTTPPGE